MTVLVAGVSHRVAPLAELAALALGPGEVAAALDRLAAAGPAEAVVLSTCNRVEVYAASVPTVPGEPAAAAPGPSAAAASAWAAAVGDRASGPRYVLAGRQAVRHLFRVACGLDSMLVGEEQVRGQVRRAYRLAAERGLTGRELHPLFQRALRLGKRATARLGAAGPSASLAALAVDVAARRLGSLAGRSALVVGAGATGTVAAEALRRAGVGELLIANRTAARADTLAGRLGGRTVPFDRLAGVLAHVDVVASSTAARSPVLPAGLVAAAATAPPRRPDRPLVLLDLAMPHDVDPAVRTLPGVELVTLADLGRLAADPTAPGGGGGDGVPPSTTIATSSIAALVAAEVEDYLTFVRHAAAGPAIGALHELAGAVIDEELGRLYGRAPQLDPELRAEVERTARRIARKLLHGPAVQARRLSARPDGERYLEAISELLAPPR